MLNVIVFICGAGLMALEMVAARMLAPALGNSIFVWGSVISIVMIALSVGYWAGGQLADRRDASRVLAPLIAAAGLLTVLVPSVAEAILPWAAELGPRAGSLARLGAHLLLARARARDRLASERAPRGVSRPRAHRPVGRRVVRDLDCWQRRWHTRDGVLAHTAALLGAARGPHGLRSVRLRVRGPLAPEALRTRQSGHGRPRRGARGARNRLGRTLAHARAGARGRGAGRVGARGRGAGLGRQRPGRTRLVPARQPVPSDHRHRGRQHPAPAFRRHQPVRHRSLRRVHGARSPTRTTWISPWPRSRTPRRCSSSDLAAAPITKRWWRDYPGVTIDSVEIDPVVVDVSRRYFGLPEDSRLRVFNEDARRFVKRSKDTYDIVIVDCYYAEALPSHLTTEEFFSEVKKRMSPDGVLAYNVISSVGGDGQQVVQEHVPDGRNRVGPPVGVPHRARRRRSRDRAPQHHRVGDRHRCRPAKSWCAASRIASMAA